MADLSHRQLVLCVLGAVVAIALGVSRLKGDEAPVASAERATPIALEADDGGGGRVVVHVAGAVRRPGVYKLPASARVDDAVTRAGGATRRADLGGLNLAAKVADGRQVLVPKLAAPASASPPATGTGAVAPAEGQPLNLNTATLEQLDLLSGIGPVTAQKILDAREERGGFGSVEELGEIPGIGDKRLESLRAEVTL